MKSLLPLLKQGSFNVIAIVGVCTLLAGCSIPNPKMDDMAAEYQGTIEQYNFNNILLNIVRGSNNLPLSFLDIPSIIGTGNFSAGTGASSFTAANLSGSIINGSTSSLMLNPSITVSNSFNYTQSSLDNAAFQNGFNGVIPLTTVNFFKTSNMPPELVISLLVNSIDLVSADGQVEKVINSPGLDSFPKFQAIAKLMVKYGLTTQITNAEIPNGPKLTEAQATTTLNALIASKELGKLQMKYFPGSGKEKPYYQLVTVTQMATMCLAETPYVQEIISKYGDQYFCAKPVANPSDQSKHLGISSTNTPEKGKTSIAINIRSNRDIYQYLGQILKIQTTNPNIQVVVDPSYIVQGTVGKPLPIIVVKKNESVSKPLAKISYRGDTYVIPSEDNGYTALVINMMAQLLNLNKVSGSIPPSPAVLVK
jgi:hypothetical protein